MKFNSFIEKLSKTFEILFSDSDPEESIIKDVKKIEKRIISQGKISNKNYARLLQNLDPTAFEADFNSVKDSFLTRARASSKLLELANIFDGLVLAELPEKRVGGQAVITMIGGRELTSWEVCEEFFMILDDVKKDLRTKRLIKYMISFVKQIRYFFRSVHYNIQLTASIISYFDQVFTMKIAAFQQEMKVVFFYVTTKFKINGREIYRTIPVIN